MVDECFFWIHLLTSSRACLASIHGFALPVHFQYFRLVNDPYIGHENEIIQLKICCPKNYERLFFSGPTVFSLGGPAAKPFGIVRLVKHLDDQTLKLLTEFYAVVFPKDRATWALLLGGRLQLLREENLPKNTGKTQN